MIKRLRYFVTCIALVLCAKSTLWSQPTDTAATQQWVDSVYETLSLEQRIMQLVAVDSSALGERELKKLSKLNPTGEAGLVYAFRGRNRLTNNLAPIQAIKYAQLFRLLQEDFGVELSPEQLGSVQNDTLLRNLGKSVAQWLHKTKGIEAVLGFPTRIDASSEAVFSENKIMALNKTLALIKGLEEGGVMCGIDYYPLQSDDRYVVQNLIESDLEVIHVKVNRTQLINDTLQGEEVVRMQRLLEGQIREEWHYNQLLFMSTESAFSMRELAKTEAGLVLLNNDPVNQIEQLVEAVGAGMLEESRMAKKCKAVLAKKYRLRKQPTATSADLEYLLEEVVENSTVLLQNKEEILPFRRLDTLNIAHVTFGQSLNELDSLFNQYAEVATYAMDYAPTAYEKINLNEQLQNCNALIITVQENAELPVYFQELTTFLDELSRDYNTMLVWMGTPGMLEQYAGISAHNAVIQSWSNDQMQQFILPQIVFGARSPRGKLSVAIGNRYPLGVGLTYGRSIRLAYGSPLALSLDTRYLAKIDSIAQAGVDQQAYPGCQVLVAKNGHVFYNKTFGHHTYEEKQPVRFTDLYDLASITKIAASMVAVMHLQDRNQLNLDQTLGDFIPEVVGTSPYATINLREMLAHQAGLKAWIPFYKTTLENSVPRFDVYSLVGNETYPFQVAENLYIHKNYPDSILKQIVDTPLKDRGEYRYSDLGYYFIQQIVEKLTGKSLDQFVEETFYQPLGMNRTCFNPLNRFEREETVPTEYDVLFRKQLVHGTVHDPGAAMMGGVGGHAGLFSSANDLAKLMQMYMQYGFYGGERYLKAATVKEYTKCQFCADPESDNRRGAGFDKPVRDGGPGPTCECVSYASFGHSGFTGTIAWADPDEEVIFIFLSNRVYPNASNKKLIKLGIRTEIMQAIYDSFITTSTAPDE